MIVSPGVCFSGCDRGVRGSDVSRQEGVEVGDSRSIRTAVLVPSVVMDGWFLGSGS